MSRGTEKRDARLLALLAAHFAALTSLDAEFLGLLAAANAPLALPAVAELLGRSPSELNETLERCSALITPESVDGFEAWTLVEDGLSALLERRSALVARKMHGLLAKACRGRHQTGPELRLYLLRHGSRALEIVGDRTAMWELVTDEDYRSEQIRTLRRYHDACATLTSAVRLFLGSDGEDADAAKLCWSLLRAGSLAELAARDIDDVVHGDMTLRRDEVEAMLDRLSMVKAPVLVGVALLLLWGQAKEPTPPAEGILGARRLLDHLNRRLSGVDWAHLVSPQVMAAIAVDVGTRLHAVDITGVTLRTSEPAEFVAALTAHVASIADITTLEIALQLGEASADRVDWAPDAVVSLAKLAGVARRVDDGQADRLCERALEAAARAEEQLRDQAKTQLVTTFLEEGERARAEELAWTISTPHWRGDALAALIVDAWEHEDRACAASRLEAALDWGRSLDLPVDRCEALGRLGELACMQGRLDVGRELLDEAFTIATSFAPGDLYLQYLLPMARTVRHGSEAEGILTAGAGLDDRSVEILRVELAIGLVGTGDCAAARAMVASCAWSSERSRFLAALVGAGHDALALDEALSSEGSRGWALCALAEAHLDDARPETARPILERACREVHGEGTLAWLARLLVRAGATATAAELVQHVVNDYPRFLVFKHIARALVEAARPDEARAAFARSVQAAASIPDLRAHADWTQRIAGILRASPLAGHQGPLDRRSFLLEVVPALAGTGRMREARTAAEGISDASDRNHALVRACESLAACGMQSAAQELSEDVTEPASRARALARIACVASRSGQPLLAARWWDEAAQLARGIADPQALENTRLALADLALSAGETDVALARAAELEEGFSRADAIGRVAERMVHRGQYDRATELAAQAIEPVFHTSAPSLTRVSLALARRGEFARALEVLDRCPDDWRDEGRIELAELMARAGRARQAAELARALSTPQRRARTLAVVGRELVESRPLRARAILAEAQGLAERLETAQERSRLLASLARDLVWAGDVPAAQAALQSALEAARSLPDDHTREAALVAVASRLAPHHLQTIQMLIGELSDPQRVATIAAALAWSGSLDDALEIVSGLVRCDRVHGLVELVTALIDAEDPDRALDVFEMLLSAVCEQGVGAPSLAAAGERLLRAGQDGPLAAILSAVQLPAAVCSEVLPRLRWAALEHLDDPRPLLLSTLHHDPFDLTTVEDGVRALLLAQLKAGDVATYDAIVARCPQLSP